MPEQSEQSGSSQQNATPPKKRDYYAPKISRAIAKKKVRYLQSMAKNLDPVKACKFAHVDRTTVWRWQQADPQFVERLNLLNEFCTENVEGAVYRRAMKMSTADARLWLEAHKRELYGNRIDINVMLRNDPKVKALMVGVAQVLQDFVPRELLPSAINRLRAITSIADGDTGPARTDHNQIDDAGASEAGA